MPLLVYFYLSSNLSASRFTLLAFVIPCFYYHNKWYRSQQFSEVEDRFKSSCNQFHDNEDFVRSTTSGTELSNILSTFLLLHL